MNTYVIPLPSTRRHRFPILRVQGRAVREVASCKRYDDAKALLTALLSSTGTATGTPLLTAVYPSSVAANAYTAGQVTILVTGEHLRSSGVVTISTLTLTFYLNEAAIWGVWSAGDLIEDTYDVVYTDGEGNTSTLSGAFTVTPAI